MNVGRAVLILFLPNVALSLRTQPSWRRNMRSMVHCCTSTTIPIIQEIPLCLPSHLMNARVLTCGDGDMSFSAALAQWGGCKSVVASTWDSEERLFRSFDKAADNVATILRFGGTVIYGVDATKLCESFSVSSSTFDTILWNFPHVPGKQNIKRNRELLQNFLKSCRELYLTSGNSDAGYSSKGLVCKLALCGGQSGTRAGTMDEWNHSWQLTHQAGEAGWVMTEVERFDAEVMAQCFPGYEVQGHRGHGGNFPLGSGSEMFTFRLPTVSSSALPVAASSSSSSSAAASPVASSSSSSSSSSAAASPIAAAASPVAAMQVPMYIHEVHLLADRLCEDLTWLEGQARRAVVDLVDGGSSSRSSAINSVWAVNLVDVYVCPRTLQISHTFQIAYAYHPAPNDNSYSNVESVSNSSSTGVYGGSGGEALGVGGVAAVGRTRADEFRVLVERELPLALGMAPRAVKHGGRVSLAYPWFVTQAVRALKPSETSTSTTEDMLQQQQRKSVSEQLGYSHSDSSSGGNDTGNDSGGSVVVSIVEVADALRSIEDLDKDNDNSNDDDKSSGKGDCRHDKGNERDVKVDADDDAGSSVDGIGVSRARGPEEEHIRAVARTLWRRRVGVLIRTAATASTNDFQ